MQKYDKGPLDRLNIFGKRNIVVTKRYVDSKEKPEFRAATKGGVIQCVMYFLKLVTRGAQANIIKL